MPLPSDLAISRGATPKPLSDVAWEMGLREHLLEPYGAGVAKIRLEAVDELADRPPAKYVVVTAVTPTPLGEGKTTTTVGLGQAMKHIGRRAVITIRQPSMGPTFGIKGGAAGGGYSQVIPMELLNLHLTGDFHAVTAANNLLAAMLDNHLHQGDELGIDPHNITWRRVLDVNDRALRNIVVGLGERQDGVVRQTGFDITAASEVMAVLALATSAEDLRARLGRIVVAYTAGGEPVTAEQLRGAGSMAVILREAIKPNLLQTLENTPVIVHAGPFGNIAHGNSSILGDLIGIRGGDYLITEAGFGADMGAERFFNIKCRTSGLVPDAAVVVTTVRALKLHSGRHRIVAGRPLPPEMLVENPDDVAAGAVNLRKQIENVLIHGVTPVVAINAFPEDHASEHDVIRREAEAMGVRVAVCTHFADGGAGRDGPRPRGGRGVRRAQRLPLPVPGLGEPAGEDRNRRHERLRCRARGVLAGRRPPARDVRAQWLRSSPRVHRQDPPVDLGRPGAEGRPDRSHARRPRGQGLGGGGVRVPDLRRDAHDARARRDPRGVDHRLRRRRGDRGALLMSERSERMPRLRAPASGAAMGCGGAAPTM